MSSIIPFKDLGLSASTLSAVEVLGYETPSPIQAQAIPLLLEGKDIIAQAQTGTGKTAAFALPILTHLNLKQLSPQAIVLAPTRELAIQVAEAFQSYAKHMQGFHVLPIYGGQPYQGQLKALKRGVHVVVGTPGRVMDHLRRGTLRLDNIKHLVLDEADEMLNMGFVEDVKWILEQIPGEHQKALFSATMPPGIKNIVKQHFPKAIKIQIKPEAKNLPPIDQYYMILPRERKLEALTRFLEIEEVDATIIFTRTKTMSAELAEKLAARGYSAAALNGDMQQSQREKVIAQVKRKALDIVVATEVAARGLDVDRISHVINYDIPYDTESYTHRIGRTGRAGREGKALLFVSPREQRVLRDIERGLHQKIKPMELPSIKQVNAKRAEKLIETISAILIKEDLSDWRCLIEKITHQSECSELDVAAAFAYISQKQKFGVMKEEIRVKKFGSSDRPRNSERSRSKFSDRRKPAFSDSDRKPKKRKSNDSRKKSKPKSSWK